MPLTPPAPCWPDPDVQCCPDWDTAEPEVRQRAMDVAARILHGLSGRRFGVCEVSVRPCSPCADSSTVLFYGPAFIPYFIAGQWRNCAVGGCDCTESCGCCHVCSVVLPGPVHHITSVTVDGVLVPASAYRVDDARELVRTDGECWPDCPDLEADCDLVGGGAFCVTYGQGVELDGAAMAAYSEYACQLLKSCLNKPCELPARVTSVTREGVTFDALSLQDFLDKGRTGITIVDQWLITVNPNRLSRPSKVYSPDIRPARVTTWP